MNKISLFILLLICSNIFLLLTINKLATSVRNSAAQGEEVLMCTMENRI